METLTPQDVTFGLAVFGALAGLWWRVEARIDVAKRRADEAAERLASYKTHIAENYVTKDGMRDQLSQVMEGIAEIKSQMTHIAARVDGLYDQQSRRPRSGASS